MSVGVWSPGLDPCEPGLPAWRLPAGGRRLQDWLLDPAAGLGREPRQLLAEGRVRLDGRSVLPGSSFPRPVAGSVLSWVPEALDPAALAEAIPVPILHEDAALLVVDKPAALVMSPGPGHPAGTLANAVRALGRPLSGREGPSRPGLVHRLDRGVSGALLVATGDEVHVRLVQALAARQVERDYLALVMVADGAELPAEGARCSWLGVRRSGRKARASVDPGAPGAQAAETRWSLLGRGPQTAWLRVRPVTGRQHQIRVHLAEAGLPLVGDLLYGGLEARRLARRLGLGRPALHAAAIRLAHPLTGQPLEVKAPLPADLARLSGA